MTDSNDYLERQIEQTLKSDNSILESCRRFLDVISPTVAAICDQVSMVVPNRDLVYRCIIKRSQENLWAIIDIAKSSHPYMSTLPLRPLCEDLIYGVWLRTLPPEESN